MKMVKVETSYSSRSTISINLNLEKTEFSPLQKKQFYSPDLGRNKISRYMKQSSSVSGKANLLNTFQQRLERFRRSNYTKDNENKDISQTFNGASTIENNNDITPEINGSRLIIKNQDQVEEFFDKRKNFFAGFDKGKENGGNSSPLSALLNKSNYSKPKFSNGYIKETPKTTDTRFVKAYKFENGFKNLVRIK